MSNTVISVIARADTLKERSDLSQFARWEHIEKCWFNLIRAQFKRAERRTEFLKGGLVMQKIFYIEM